MKKKKKRRHDRDCKNNVLRLYRGFILEEPNIRKLCRLNYIIRLYNMYGNINNRVKQTILNLKRYHLMK